MRRFVVLGHTQRATPPLPLNDLAGAGGRWDLLARCVTSGLLLSHGIRDDAEVVLVLRSLTPPRVIRVEGRRVERLNPDERSTAALMSRALEVPTVAEYEEESSPGIWASRRPLGSILEAARTEGPLVWLHEQGTDDISGLSPAKSTTFVLSDHREFTPDESQLLQGSGAARLRLGPRILQADQGIVVAHHWCDRAEAG